MVDPWAPEVPLLGDICEGQVFLLLHVLCLVLFGLLWGPGILEASVLLAYIPAPPTPPLPPSCLSTHLLGAGFELR